MTRARHQPLPLMSSTPTGRTSGKVDLSTIGAFERDAGVVPVCMSLEQVGPTSGHASKELSSVRVARFDQEHSLVRVFGELQSVRVVPCQP